MKEFKIAFQGRVQKVGFRWTVVDVAQRLGLVGTVQNLPDGTVSAIVQGEKEAVLSFIDALKNEPGAHKITNVSLAEQEGKAAFSDFTIKHFT